MAEGRVISELQMDAYLLHLQKEEKSPVTIVKYLRDIRNFGKYIGKDAVTKQKMIDYKRFLVESGYAATSINSMLAAINSLMSFLEWHDCKVKTLRIQRRIYCREEAELTKAEYLRLLKAAQDQRLNLIIQTLCGTGIRISELKYFTVEAIKRGEVIVRCKNKMRTILVPKKLREKLLSYARSKKIKTKQIFVTSAGKPMDRSNIWRQMKKLCRKAKVNPKKVFPHNLRKLFARTFYRMDNDIAKLADILGHGNIETTRIYLMSTGAEHRQKIEKMGLII